MAKSLREVTEERDRAQRTAESLATIEAGLSAREAAAGEAAVEERRRLVGELAGVREALEGERALGAQRLVEAAGERAERAAALEAARAAAASAREEAAGAVAEAGALKSQVATLSEHLAGLRSRVEARVAALGGRGDVESSRLGSLEGAVATLTAELTTAKEALVTKEKHLAGEWEWVGWGGGALPCRLLSLAFFFFFFSSLPPPPHKQTNPLSYIPPIPPPLPPIPLPPIRVQAFGCCC